MEQPQGVGQWQGAALFVAPHAMYFIGDQLRSVEKRVQRVSVLIPSPRFSSVALRLPFVSGRFTSLRRARESGRGIQGQNLIRARYLDVPGRFGKGLTNSLAAGSSLHAVERTGASFDIIHSHFLGLYGYIGQRLKEKLRKPLVLSAYGGDAYSIPFRNSFNRKLAESTVREADGLIAVSRPIAENLVTLGADSNRVRVIPTGFDSSLFAPVPKEEARSKLGLPQQKKIVLNVANLVPQKGQLCLLESFKRVLGLRRDLVLIFVGGGEMAGALRSKAAELGISESVTFAGPRPHEEIPTWINACDLFVLPSLSEGSPTVIPEAMACGKPVVATNVGGIPDILTEVEQGRIVLPNDVSGLADAIEEALERRWSDQAIRTRALSYSWEALSARIVEVYQAASRG